MKTLLTTFLSLTFFTSLQAQNTLIDKEGTKNTLIEKAFTAAGDNKAEIKKALAKAPAEQRKGMVFLIAHMPEKDLKTLTADFLLENVSLAYKARAEFPWAKQVPEDIFLNDVLPYAVLNERRDNWRKDFYTRFSKQVSKAKTMEEAIKIISTGIAKEVNVKYSTKRKKPDQSPYESMEIGMASCTGLSILLNDAFRSVGIPARVAGIPMWTTKRGNHNWVEVWTPSDKQWHFTEYYPDAKGLDHGWLLPDAAKANPKSLVHSIYASSWKPQKSHFPLVWDWDNKTVPGVNNTAMYIKLGGGDKIDKTNQCELRIDFINAKGQRQAIPVAIVQGDVEIAKGKTPSVTQDMNQFFTHHIPKGQIFQVAYLVPGQKKWQTKQVKAEKKDKFLSIKLTP